MLIAPDADARSGSKKERRVRVAHVGGWVCH